MLSSMKLSAICILAIAHAGLTTAAPTNGGITIRQRTGTKVPGEACDPNNPYWFCTPDYNAIVGCGAGGAWEIGQNCAATSAKCAFQDRPDGPAVSDIQERAMTHTY